MIQLGKFDDPASMKRASIKFLEALNCGSVKVEAKTERLECGHDAKHAYRYADGEKCRKCRLTKKDYDRERYLPVQRENARRRLAALEAECKRRGIVF